MVTTSDFASRDLVISYLGTPTGPEQEASGGWRPVGFAQETGAANYCP